MPHLAPFEWEIAAELAQLVAFIIGLVIIGAAVRSGLRAVRDEVAQLGRDFHARQNTTNERLGELARPPAPRPLRQPTPVTVDMTAPEKPTVLMSTATLDAARREATPTPRSRPLDK